MVMFSVDQIVISIWERSYVLSLYEVLRGSCPEQGVGGEQINGTSTKEQGSWWEQGIRKS